ncbi:PspC domain-containing protein [Nocardioides sp. CGMCC 1.13656]|nr:MULTISPECIES: PspC domain-containing protein [unclassified Nocardioides]MBA2954026.1 PspC domain-containing protein [Nocardioides sp. CGMCC 1.13656]
MTTTPPEAPPPPPPAGDPGPRVTGDQVRDLGRLRRSRTDRKVAGVAGGLARHLDVDPLILRVAFVVLVFFGGAGLILYGACWLLVPEDGAERAPFHLDERTRSIALIIVGVVAALALIGDSWGAFWFPWPVAIVALVALWLLTRNNDRPMQAPPAQPYLPTAVPTAQPVAPHPPAQQPFVQQPPPPPVYYPPAAPYVRPPNPRKRGPILFWFTLALIALGLGVLGVVDLAGADVATSAYPALAVGTCGLMLLIGAFFGRAGGLIALGLVSSMVLAGTTVADTWEGDRVRERPAFAGLVKDRYWLDAGEQVIDLTRVTDLESLDGRDISIEGGVGRIEVILPEDLAATVSADVDGPGHIDLFGEERGGIDIHHTAFSGSDGDPEITIDAQLGVGEIEVSHQ